MIQNIDNIDFSGKKVLLRVDFNVPLNEQFEVTDDTRLKAAVPTILKIINDGGRLILMSHLGRPSTEKEARFSLKHIIPALSDLLKKPIAFIDNCIGSEVQEKVAQLKNGDILLLENLRYHQEETKGDADFAKELADLADIYINDAFGTAHRAHASTSVIANYFDSEHKFFGYLMQREIEAANKILNHYEKPFTAIIGGAKVSDKILIIEKLLDKCQNILIGGGMAYTFLKAQDKNIGNSLVENDKLAIAQSILKKAKDKGVNFMIPQDSVIADAFSNDAPCKNCSNENIPNDWMGLDIGLETIKTYEAVILSSKTIIWNGPMGVFEMSNFQKGTVSVAKAVAEATKLGAYSLVGGGDSVAAVNQFNLSEQVSYISTGGGAMLEYLEGKELPGIKAILNN